jgi:hypothetical protein
MAVLAGGALAVDDVDEPPPAVPSAATGGELADGGVT